MLQKKILHYTLLCGLVLIAGYAIHNFILEQLNIEHPFNLWHIYLFQGIATLILCINFEFISQKMQQLKDQLGFFYLAAMAVKVGLFSLFFKDILFSSLVLSKTDSLSLLIPVFLFLFLEVLIIVKILNRNN
ncbi:DUF6168 family protein [Aequorivita xiaoshiensis]|uniref:DUF6168 family protein n=1 Tax=Aequorivita xiaoshiensis TaxID=2874476 RepID=A0A9X1R1S5_9FLAO|nr:DUF6168 family protein [Aequorivita xiaoshiensis]MCG2429998.1 DUF6168 family protein [Aequorivita xiaoshiensis]